MAFTGLKGELLLVHGLRIELRKRVRGATKGGVHGSIDLVQARRHRLPLLPHPHCKIPLQIFFNFSSAIRSLPNP
uniref:Uncharacterized protein n=1 Tax=Vitis vinifera TaxID=29760 RepID=A5AYH2_VITVI|nr:hypothetical protein VITISV_010840 [Vitis vinifera]